MTPVVRLGPNTRNSWSVATEEVSFVRSRRDPLPVSVAAAPQNLTLDLARTAVVVVDMQNDFCSEQGWLAGIGVDVSGAAVLVPVITDVLRCLRARGVPVVWLSWGNRPDRANLPPGVLHVYDPAGQGTGIGSALPGTDSRVLELGSWSAALVDGLTPDPADLHVAKFRMSGFWDTPLESILRNLRVDTVLFAGVNADQCVLATLIDAACAGFDVVMMEDAVGTTSPSYCLDATVYNVRQVFGFTLLARDLTAALA